MYDETGQRKKIDIELQVSPGEMRYSNDLARIAEVLEIGPLGEGMAVRSTSDGIADSLADERIHQLASSQSVSQRSGIADRPPMSPAMPPATQAVVSVSLPSRMAAFTVFSKSPAPV